MSIGIVGGGIAGLCAGYALASKEREFYIYDPSPGGAYGRLSGLKYLHDTVTTRRMLAWLDVDCGRKIVRGAIIPSLKDPTYQLSEWNDPLRRDMYIKTRRTIFGYDGTSSNEGKLSEPAIDISLAVFVDLMRGKLSEYVTPHYVVDISGGVVQHEVGARRHDLIVFTLPFHMAKLMVSGFSHRGGARTMSLVNTLVECDDGPVFEVEGVDYWYIPDTSTPFHRVSRVGTNQYVFEANAEDDETAVDLRDAAKSHCTSLLRGSGRVVGQSIVPGHLLPLLWPPIWPPRIYPLGRFAQWDSRATADVVLERAVRLAKMI